MAGNKSGWWDGLFKKKSDRWTRTRKVEDPGIRPPASPPLASAPDASGTSDSTVWKQGQVILGEYVVEGELGEGGMGTVYLLVRSQSTGHRFAVKKLKKTRFRDEASQRNFLSELQTWLDLPEHPHLVACRFFRTVGDELAIFAEYVEGGSLAAWIAQRRLTQLEPILDVAIQFAWGLHAAHELGLVHQDVKPGNVLMSPEGVAKVSDFGLARARAAAGEREATGGQSILVSYGGRTEEYCSPEQLDKQPVSRKTDIWSFGVSVLEVFTGEVSWTTGIVAGDALENYVNRAGSSAVWAPKALPLMPVGVVQVLRRCFRQKPEDRWGTMLELAEALKGVYRECTGREYHRSTPVFPRASERRVVAHDRRTAGGGQWVDPRKWLVAALKADGRDPAEAEALLSPREGSRRAQAVADLATYEEALRIYERLIAAGRQDLESGMARLSFHKASIHTHLDDAPGALALYDRVSAIWERLVEQGQPELADELAGTYQNKANALKDQGDLTGAVGLYDQALAIFERLVEEGRPELADLAMTCQNKATALVELGDLAGAVGLYDRALAIVERLVEEGRRELADDLAMTYHNKAIALRVVGDLAGAVGFFDRALAIYERLVEKEARSDLADMLAGTYQDKAIALRVVGDLAGAVGLFDRGLEIFERLVEEGRRELADPLAMSYMNKAGALQALGDLAGAVGFFDRALAIYERLFEKEGRSDLRDDLAMTYQNKANVLQALGDLAGAVGCYDRTLAIYERLVEQERRSDLADELAGTYQNKANVLVMHGDLAGAVGLYDRVLAIRERLVEEGRPELAKNLAMTYQNKAFALRELGDFDGAVGLYDRALAIYERLVHQERRGELANELAATYLNKADVLPKLRDLAGAVGLYDRALAIYERLVEEGRRELAGMLARTYQNKAIALAALGDLAGAVGCFDRALEIRERLVEEGRPELAKDLARTYQNKALTLAERGDLAGAVGCFDRALAIVEPLVGQDGQRELRGDLAWVQAGKAGVLLSLGERGAASALARQAVRVLEEEVLSGRADLRRNLDFARNTLTACSLVDEKIGSIRTGASVVEVIQLLGKPHEAWGSPLGEEMVFIYSGKNIYSILFMGGMAIQVHESRLGGPNAVPFNEKIDVVISGNRIEFRRDR